MHVLFFQRKSFGLLLSDSARCHLTDEEKLLKVGYSRFCACAIGLL